MSSTYALQMFSCFYLSTNIETVSCPCSTCFWYALALALRNTSRGGSIFIANLHATFNDILRKKHGTLFYCGLRQWASLSMGRVLRFSQTHKIDSVWCIYILSDFLSYYAWTLMSYILFTVAIFCRVTLENLYLGRASQLQLRRSVICCKCQGWVITAW